MGKLDSILNKAMGIADVAGKKTGELVEISKLRLQIAQLNSDLDRVYRRIGELGYQQYKLDLNNEVVIEAAYNEVDALIAEIDKLSAKYATANNKLICVNCAAQNSQESVFCSRCGVSLAEQQVKKED